VLCDDDKRKIYDQFGVDGLKQQVWGGQGFDWSRFTHAEDVEDIFGADFFQSVFGRSGGLGGTLFEDFFGGGTVGRRRGPAPGRDARVDLEVALEMPEGVPDGVQLRIPGRGLAGDAGAPPGDLYVAIHVRPHHRFVRDGDDLVLELPISFADAALGTEVEVPTMEGTTRLRVPAGVQTHTTLRLRGKGLPRFQGHGRGDQLVRVSVITPTRLSAEER